MYRHLVKSGRAKVSKMALNDNSCGWVETLPKRNDIRRLQGDLRCQWAVIGAGLCRAGGGPAAGGAVSAGRYRGD